MFYNGRDIKWPKVEEKYLLKEVNEILNKTNVEVIAQNLTSSKSTSDTGGITAVYLRNLNVNRSIIAHSEARIRQKNPQDVINQIIPMGFQFVLCFEEIDQIPFNLLKNSINEIYRILKPDGLFRLSFCCSRC